MFIVNPPWTLKAQLAEAMPTLVRLLGQDGAAKFTLEGESS
jgi:23S rRNA (adenine2030-N6)-methyltransferase